jgi:heme exporter protein D
MVAYDYPILGLFWSMLIFFLFFAWIVILFRVFADIFRSDMGGFAKAIWSIFVILVPFLGVFIYLIVHGDAMTQRNIADAQQSEQAFQAYVRDAAGTGGVASELSQLADLKNTGAITEAEFEAQKAKLLAN